MYHAERFLSPDSSMDNKQLFLSLLDRLKAEANQQLLLPLLDRLEAEANPAVAVYAR